MLMILPVSYRGKMHRVNFYSWQEIISTDLKSVLRLIDTEQADYMTFARPMVGAAIANERLLCSSLLILSSRALGISANCEETLHAFAAAMELIVLSLQGHASLRDDCSVVTPHPLFALGSAAGILLGDLLYTHAFRIIVRTGHMEGLAEVASATERMINSSTLERFPPASEIEYHSAPNSFRAEAYSACCALAGVLTCAHPVQSKMLHEFGTHCGSRLTPGIGHDLNQPADPPSLAFPILARCFQPSGYRDALQTLVNLRR
jgi:octaprenyl-diphosphate synthase